MESTGNYAAKGGVAMAQKKAGILEMIQCIHNNIDDCESVLQGTWDQPKTDDQSGPMNLATASIEEMLSQSIDEVLRANERLSSLRERLFSAVGRF